MKKLEKLRQALKARNKELAKMPCPAQDQVRIAENKETLKLITKIKKEK
jgi:hypothetical protein